MSQDAAQEFQVNRSNYAADLGGATALRCNIVTESGTNDVHGSVYSFFRNGAMWMHAIRSPGYLSARTRSNLRTHRSRSLGSPIKDSLARISVRRQRGLSYPQGQTFSSSLRRASQNTQNAVPLLTNAIFYWTDEPLRTRFSARSSRRAPRRPASINPTVRSMSLPANICAGALQPRLTTGPLTGLYPWTKCHQHLSRESAGIQRWALQLQHAPVPVFRTPRSSL